MELTKSEVNRAGAELAIGYSEGKPVLTEQAFAEHRRVVDEWRQLHAEQLVWVTEKLGARVEPLSGHIVIAQRLKRMPQIVKKLARFGSMKLARMQDIGGCRVVLDTPPQVNEAERLIRNYGTHRWIVRHEADYTENGKPDTSYRAKHLIVIRDARLIEIQLRTARQHAWAEAVERVSALSTHGVKEGDAPEEILEYFRLASDGFWELDSGRTVPNGLRMRCSALHSQVADYLTPGTVVA